MTPDEVKTIQTGLESFTGYSIINADTMDDAIVLAKANPMITSVVLYDLARM